MSRRSSLLKTEPSFHAPAAKLESLAGTGVLSWLTGSQRPAILSVGLFFITGMIILSMVNEKKGKAAALIPIDA